MINPDPPWSFVSTIPEAHVEVISDRGLEANGSFTVEWRAEVELRSWGIRSITPLVQCIRGLMHSFDEDALPEQFESRGNEYVIEEQFTHYPSFIVINMERMLITIT